MIKRLSIFRKKPVCFKSCKWLLLTLKLWCSYLLKKKKKCLDCHNKTVHYYCLCHCKRSEAASHFVLIYAGRKFISTLQCSHCDSCHHLHHILISNTVFCYPSLKVNVTNSFPLVMCVIYCRVGLVLPRCGVRYYFVWYTSDYYVADCLGCCRPFLALSEHT